jgi:hypothetical protein
MSPKPVVMTCLTCVLVQDFLHDVAEVVEHEQHRGAGVDELVLELARRCTSDWC